MPLQGEVSAIREEEARFFEENGYLIVRGVLRGDELARIQAALQDVVGYGAAQVRDDPDYMYGAGHKTGEKVLRRVEYVIEKREECKVLLGHPFILRSVERLLGKDLIPTWDSMVLKMPGQGIIVPWHRDAGTDCLGDKPIFNVDYYLDEADEDTCVWVIPGSHLWDQAKVADWLKERAAADKTKEDFQRTGAVPALMQPGDVLFHNILLLHGSPANVSEKQRRVLYYEFRAAHVEQEFGPHVPAYIPLKQKVLLACIAKRKAADYIPADEIPYQYDPPAPWNTTRISPGVEPPTYRYAHQEYWRPAAWSPEVSLTLKSVGQCRVSPDGNRAVFTVTQAIMEEEKSEYRTQLWLTSKEGGDPFPITFGETSSSNPRWSPDGRFLAFTAKRSERTELYRLRVEGGEAEKLTDSRADVGDFRWSPDGNWIAFLRADAPTEAEEKRSKAKDDWRFEDEEIKYTRLFMVPVEPNNAGKRDAVQLTTGTMQVGSFDWSPEGTEIAFDHTTHPKADYWPSSRVSVLEVATGAVRPLVTGSRAAFRPLYSPDGSRIACILSADPPRWSFEGVPHVVPRSGGIPRALEPSPDRQANLLGWSEDGTGLYFIEARGVSSGIYCADVATGANRLLLDAEGFVADIDLNASRTQFGFIRQTTTQPGDAYTASVRDLTPRQISHANPDLPKLPLGKTEVLRWKSTDGQEIEGLLTYPTSYTPGKRAPLLLVIHGGPAGVFQQNFIGNPGVYPVASFAARGYAVLRCNPRGSSGYGEPFRSANRKDWGGGDYRDLMTGVDHVIALGVADPDRMGVMGWSYGGFMTSWVITQTDRFKAASVGAAVTNLMSFNGTADIPSFIPDYFEAQSWENLELYRDHSAMFQVGNVKTPALIQHGDQDVRVPISQGYEFYNALKQLGVETRMLVLPRQPHGPNEPRMQLKAMQSNLEWFQKYIG